MKKVTVQVESPYDVIIERGLLARCGEVFKKYEIRGQLAVISDSIVAPLYCVKLKTSLKKAGYTVKDYVIPAGEQSKTMDTLQGILSFLAKNGFDRGDIVVALGGGVIGDIAGFAAGVYLRGISYVQIPTTLLAAVDSSVGGKTAIDLPEGKNLAGLFLHPRLVITDLDCFQSLPEEIFRQGMGEVIKTAILKCEELFSLLEASQGELQNRNIEEIIEECVSYKAGVVEKDFKETGLRRLLNLGHTPAHAIEKCSGYKVAHGDAVGCGLQLMAAGAMAEGKLGQSDGKRIMTLLKQEKFPMDAVPSADELAKEACFDKKRKGNTITRIMPFGIGDCRQEQVTLEEMKAFYKKAEEWRYES